MVRSYPATMLSQRPLIAKYAMNGAQPIIAQGCFHDRATCPKGEAPGAPSILGNGGSHYPAPGPPAAFQVSVAGVAVNWFPFAS